MKGHCQKPNSGPCGGTRVRHSRRRVTLRAGSSVDGHSGKPATLTPAQRSCLLAGFASTSLMGPELLSCVRTGCDAVRSVSLKCTSSGCTAPSQYEFRPNFPRNSPLKYLPRGASIASTARHELAEREGFELGRVTLRISKLLIRIGAHVPSSPPNSPYLPPELPPGRSRCEAQCCAGFVTLHRSVARLGLTIGPPQPPR